MFGCELPQERNFRTHCPLEEPGADLPIAVVWLADRALKFPVQPISANVRFAAVEMCELAPVRARGVHVPLKQGPRFPSDDKQNSGFGAAVPQDARRSVPALLGRGIKRQKPMMRIRWLIAIAAGLFPLLAGAALQQSTDSARPSVGGPQAKVTNPHGPISIPCQECHTYTSWKPIRSNPEFNHDQTGYPLRGMHTKVPCTKCHVSLIFKNVSTRLRRLPRRHPSPPVRSQLRKLSLREGMAGLACANSRSPESLPAGRRPCDCCNATTATRTRRSASSLDSRQPATPATSRTSRRRFWTTLRQVSRPRAKSCHTMDTWFNAKFDHLKVTGYALTGAHATLPCTACHANNVFAGTPATCYACHASDYTTSN